uniref:Uncharacterized protein n=1 Tax=Eutreptiella gymnastica TaxID=73025 RepID=A0A7S4D301_9EUGL
MEFGGSIFLLSEKAQFFLQFGAGDCILGMPASVLPHVEPPWNLPCPILLFASLSENGTCFWTNTTYFCCTSTTTTTTFTGYLVDDAFSLQTLLCHGQPCASPEMCPQACP